MVSQTDAVIVAAKRTPLGVGKPGRGALAGVHPVDLSAQLLTAVVAAAGVSPEHIDDVMWGCVTQVGEQSSNIGRNAVLAAGLPEQIPAMTIDRQCGSSQQAIHSAAAAIISGQADVVIAGGVEVMSRVPMFSNATGGEGPYGPAMRARYPQLVPQGESAELIADRWQLGRTSLDELAVTSHERAAAAAAAGRFDDEIVAVQTPAGVVSADQGIRPGTSLEVLAGLKPPFRENGVVTAGNASQISDGAAALVMMSGEKARQMGLTPLARVHTATVVGSDPVLMLTGPIAATARVLDRAGLPLDDIGAFEVNEAFASVLGAWLHDTGADPALVNPLGGAIALGHPLGASGARLATTLVHHLRETGVRYGLQTMCEGGGMANATIFERV